MWSHDFPGRMTIAVTRLLWSHDYRGHMTITFFTSFPAVMLELTEDSAILIMETTDLTSAYSLMSQVSHISIINF